MTGFALGDKFIGVSTDNIYTKQELDTKLQDKQNTLIAGQGININEDGTISANTNLDVSNPLELAYPQLPNHGISLNDDGTFRRIAGVANQDSIPSIGSGFRIINFSSSNLSGQTSNTIPINNYDAAYANWEAGATIVHEMLLVNEGGSNPRESFVFGNLEDSTFTMKACIGLNEGGLVGIQINSLTFTGGSWSSKVFTPSGTKYCGSGTVSYGVRGDDDYCKFGLNEGGNYALTFYDKATNTLKAHVEFTKGDFKTVVQSCNCVLLPFGYVDYESNASLHYDPEYNKVLSSTGTELWTATIPNTSVTPTLQLNYDSTLTLNGDNLGVNTSNLGLATVATTGSYMDLTNTPEEYVLPTASTDTLGGVKVDGTSIVIADGVISTNTGTGVDTYTKVEVNNLLSAKQDTITPSSPLSITKEVRSNLEGFQYTTDSTGVYTTGNYYWSVFNVPLTFTISSGALPGDTLNPETFSNKIVIPYSLGQVVKVPTAKSLSSLNPYTNYIFGKLLQDGTFVPIVNWHINPSYLIMKDTPSAYGGTYGNTLQLSYADTGLQNPTASEQITTGSIDITFSLIQMREDVDGSIWVDIDNGYVYGVFQQNQVQKYQYHYTNTEYVNRLKEINSCILAPVSNNGMDVNNAIQVEDIGLYANPGNLYNLITSENYNNIDLGENLFDLSGEQAYNYLDLNIDNTLKINENSQLSVNTDSFATSEDLANKLDITKCTNVPVGLEHSFFNGILTVQPGYVKSKLGQIILEEALSTADISTQQNAIDNGVILGTSTSTKSISFTGGSYLYGTTDTGSVDINTLTVNELGSQVFQSSSQGTYAGVVAWGYLLPEALPSTSYTIKFNDTYNVVYQIKLLNGEVGNFTEVASNNGRGRGQVTVNLTSTRNVNAIVITGTAANSFTPIPFNMLGEYQDIATKFNTYLVKDSSGLSIKMALSEDALFNYEDYALIGSLDYNGLVAYPQEDLANKYLLGELEQSGGDLPDNITTQGNTFNGASQLVQLDSSGKLPAVDGSQLTNLPAGSAPANMVTTDTEQTITGTKTFETNLVATQYNATTADQGYSLNGIRSLSLQTGVGVVLGDQTQSLNIRAKDAPTLRDYTIDNLDHKILHEGNLATSEIIVSLLNRVTQLEEQIQQLSTNIDAGNA